MGLAVSPQLANLYCCTIERDFVLARKRTDEAAFRWIDDILTFGSIPSEEQHGMQHKQTTTDPKAVTFVGIGVRKEDNPPKIELGVHWRDEGYPVRIIRHPNYSSANSTQNFKGVILGQFVRCQRICNRLRTFKEGITQVTLNALRRGCGRTVAGTRNGHFDELRSIGSGAYVEAPIASRITPQLAQSERHDQRSQQTTRSQHRNRRI